MAVVDYGTATNRTKYYPLSVDQVSRDTTLDEFLTTHLGDTGYYIVVRFTSFGVTTASDSVNISSADSSSHLIILKSPTGVIKKLSAQFRTDGTDGMIQAFIQGGDVTEVGDWKVFGRVFFNDESISTEEGILRVWAG